MTSEDAGRLAGTPLYLAPELAAGAAPSPASDLWSLSLVLYEAITGRNPFASSSVVGALRLVAAAERARRAHDQTARFQR